MDKLVRRRAGWLQDHPELELITRRYLAHQRSYVVDATARLAALDDPAPVVHEAVFAVLALDSEPVDPRL